MTTDRVPQRKSISEHKMSAFTKAPASISDDSIAALKAERDAASEPFVSKITGRVIEPHFQGKGSRAAVQQQRQAAPNPAQRGVGGNTPVQDFEAEGNPAKVQPVAQPALSRTAVPTGVRVPVIAGQPVAQVTPAQAPASTEPTKESPEIYEVAGKGFVRIYKEKGTWFSEVHVTNGSGVQRYSGNSLMEVLAKVSVAQVHGTVEIRTKSRQVKLSMNPDLMDTFMGRVYQTAGLTKAQFEAQPIGARSAQINTQAGLEAVQFAQENLDYHGTEFNGNAIKAFIQKNGWPYTSHNLALAVRALEGKLETKESTEPVAPVAPVVEPQMVAAEPVVVAAPTPRKRGQQLSGIVPGRSNVTEEEAFTSSSAQSLSDIRRAASSPEGLKALQQQERQAAALRQRGKNQQYRY